MSWIIGLLAINTAILAFIALRVDSGIAAIQRTIIAASDLNLEAYQRLLGHFDDLERRKARLDQEQRMREY